MPNSKTCEFLAAVLLCPAALGAQETHLVHGTALFDWPKTQASATRSNTLPKGEIESFLNSLRTQVPGYGPSSMAAFRFVPLEKDRFYLIAAAEGRIEWNTDVVAPEGQGYQYTEIESHGPFPLTMQAVDLGGAGVDELVTADLAFTLGLRRLQSTGIPFGNFTMGCPRMPARSFRRSMAGLSWASLIIPRCSCGSFRFTNPKAVRSSWWRSGTFASSSSEWY